MGKDEEKKGSVYLRVGESGVLELQAKAVTIQQLVHRYYNYFLDGPQEGYQVIRHDFKKLPEVGVFVFEGADLDEVRVALAEKWGLDKVSLLEKPLRIRLEVPIPEGFTDEDLVRAISSALWKAFPDQRGMVNITPG